MRISFGQSCLWALPSRAHGVPEFFYCACRGAVIGVTFLYHCSLWALHAHAIFTPAYSQHEPRTYYVALQEYWLVSLPSFYLFSASLYLLTSFGLMLVTSFVVQSPLLP